MKTSGTSAYRNTGIVFLLLLLLGCERKREILFTENGTGPDGNPVTISTYAERDSVFRETVSGRRRISLIRCKSENDLADSNFTQVDYYPSGGLQAFRRYSSGRQDGTWTSWYASGKKRSVSQLRNGIVIAFWSYYDDGTIEAASSRDSLGMINRTEHFRDGKTKTVFSTDSTGNGVYEEYFPNGKIKTSGHLMQFTPGGIWKRFDSAGQALPDTLYMTGKK